ncbi:hypothetical protein GH714_034589 [Hevea brasiliensis]|uniref:RING-type E3 ubiquitin transferase n=1 Tax=Hevea brasiliensis TaxID=3981 RepID=A0A6A6L5W5_HEVBR|nr:hypothetical protein GH714_034589 [Hevea brasiliensis]
MWGVGFVAKVLKMSQEQTSGLNMDNPFYQQALVQHLERIGRQLSNLADRIERIEQNSGNGRQNTNEGQNRARGSRVNNAPPIDDWGDENDDDSDEEDDQHSAAHDDHHRPRGMRDGSVGTRSGPFKRKSASISISCERGSTSKSYGAGSSSNSFQLQLEKPSSEYRNYSSVSIGLPHRDGSLSIGPEDASRNVRSRSRIDLEPNPRRTYSSIYSSQPYCSTSHLQDYHGLAEVANINTDATAYEQNHIGFPPAQQDFKLQALTMLDRSYLYGSRNLFDQYRDMRLDIDNMSYEELLALGERIGNVNTGLSSKVISECLMETIFTSDKNPEEASCAICLEEYKMDEVGTMRNCGHDYHVACIEKWLSMKNACPICKAPAFSESSNGQ